MGDAGTNPQLVMVGCPAVLAWQKEALDRPQKTKTNITYSSRSRRNRKLTPPVPDSAAFGVTPTSTSPTSHLASMPPHQGRRLGFGVSPANAIASNESFIGSPPLTPLVTQGARRDPSEGFLSLWENLVSADGSCR